MAGPYLSLLVRDSKLDKLVNDLILDLFWTWVQLPPPPPFIKEQDNETRNNVEDIQFSIRCTHNAIGSVGVVG